MFYLGLLNDISFNLCNSTRCKSEAWVYRVTYHYLIGTIMVFKAQAHSNLFLIEIKMIPTSCLLQEGKVCPIICSGNLQLRVQQQCPSLWP